MLLLLPFKKKNIHFVEKLYIIKDCEEIFTYRFHLVILLIIMIIILNNNTKRLSFRFFYLLCEHKCEYKCQWLNTTHDIVTVERRTSKVYLNWGWENEKSMDSAIF